MTMREIKWTIFTITVIGNFIAMLDSTSVNLALYPISQDLGITIAQVQWVITSYMIVLTVLLPFFGKLGDVLPKNKLYMSGFLIFALGAFFNTTTASFTALIISRCVEAVGASIMISNSSAIIASIFKNQKRGKALGINGSAIAIGGMLGPSIGGFLINYFSWHAIFIPLIPIALMGAYLAYKILPSYVGKNNKIKGFDFTVFKIKTFAFGNLAIMMSYVTMFTNAILLPIFLQVILKFNPLITGCLILPYSITLSFTAPLSGTFAGKHGSSVITVAAPVVMIFSLLIFTTFNEHTQIYQIILASGIMGIGNGLFQAPSNTAIIASVTKSQIGTASGILALSRNLGNILGVIITINLFALLRRYFTAGGMVHNEAFLNAYHCTMYAGIGFGIICLILAKLAYGEPAHQILNKENKSAATSV